ncbi:hypothetical protein QNI16_08710 [Cytophagaceae bacterium YF14B1]|uniref:Uncharacterized protein n=1 Tax=Xanthocytophaga flava TaxID=3048013 RepID=A0AAE3QPX4_9BACT|nr:hypothetical protein [Xanthocytophaga flavus]MDJ1480563.1 hypothetical protein [Xanthocytophaga flavus]
MSNSKWFPIIKNTGYLILYLFILCWIAFYSPWRLSKHWLQNTPEKYKKELAAIRRERKKLAQQSNGSNSRTAFVKAIDNHIFPYWYGTFWSFNGTTQVPGRGSIACGYFVTTVLRDAGLEINRSALAQMSSEQMIKALISEEHIKRFSNKSLEEFITQIEKTGEGLYIVGLDNHTGFLVNEGKGVYFVHASGAYPFCVIREKASSAAILRKSKYRIIGRISEDKSVLRSWLKV